MENKYKKWYDNIIERAKNRILNCYTENHHIIPRSLGGNNKSDNLVKLTAREHFICHILLTKFTEGKNKHKMVRAVMIMKAENKQQNRYINSKLYESLKVLYAKNQSLSMSGEKNKFFGKKHSQQSKEKMSLSKKGKHNNSWNTGLNSSTSEKLKEVGKNISKAKKGKPSKRKGLPGIKASDESKEKMKLARKGNSYWWNNGEINRRCAVSPGNEWKRGRLFSPSLYSSFCKKIND
jgi:hypothetical protein